MNTISNVYVGSNYPIKKGIMGIDKRPVKSKTKNKLRKRINANTNKRREYKLIDLTINHQEDDDSEFNFTTTESSLPPLERNSRIGSECGEETKQHERYSRSHERPREPNVAVGMKQISKRYTQHDKKSSNNNSIVINEQAISLAHGDPGNKRSEQLNIHRDYSFENHRDASLTDIKTAGNKFNMSEISATALNGRINKEKFQKVRQNLKLRKFSKSDKKDLVLNPDSRSNSRKNRVASSSSSKGKLNLEEFSRMRLENEQLKGALSKIVMKFSTFSNQIATQPHEPKTAKTSESGSSIIWKDNYHSSNKYEITKDANAEAEMINVEIGDDKDIKIQELLKQLKQKDSIIEKLQKELDIHKKAKQKQ